MDVPFYSNAEREDSIAVLKGRGITIDLLATVEPWNERVLDNIQTQQNITRYEQQVDFFNYGQQAVEFSEPEIRGADAAAFEIVDFGNTGGFPIQLVSPNQQSRHITVAFVPSELPNRGGERDNYEAELVFATNATDPVSGDPIEVTAPLIGVAWQPQVKGEGHDYGTFQVGVPAVVQALEISNNHYQDEANPTTGDTQGTHNVTVTDIRFVGDATNFTILNAPTPQAPWVIEPGQSEQLRVEFDPASGGVFTTNYEIITQPADLTDGAAPYTPVYELTALVEGGEFTVDGDSTDQYVFNAADMTITVRHTDNATRRYEVSLPQRPRCNALHYR